MAMSALSRPAPRPRTAAAVVPAPATVAARNRRLPEPGAVVAGAGVEAGELPEVVGHRPVGRQGQLGRQGRSLVREGGELRLQLRPGPGTFVRGRSVVEGAVEPLADGVGRP